MTGIWPPYYRALAATFFIAVGCQRRDEGGTANAKPDRPTSSSAATQASTTIGHNSAPVVVRSTVQGNVTSIGNTYSLINIQLRFKNDQGNTEVIRTPLLTTVYSAYNHPCVLAEPDGRTFYVRLIPSTESRGTINFDQGPFAAPDHQHDNGIIKVEFVNFGRFRDIAVLQTKVDKSGREDRGRGARLRNGESTEIGIGDSIEGFYFAIRDEQTWNTARVLAENANAFVKVTLLKHPAHD